jgi:hypothetical protein
VASSVGMFAPATRHRTNERLMAAVAHVGLAARALIYLMIGWLALQIALGHSRQEANQKGAVAAIAQHHGGAGLLWLLGVGLAGYALWRFSEAAFGTVTDGPKAGPRIQSFVRGAIYTAMAIMTFAFVAGARGAGQDQQQQTLTARLMRHTPGRVMLGIVGLVVVLVGIAMIVEGARRTFKKQLRMGELHGVTRAFVIGLGTVGTIARGVVFALAGSLILDAVVTYQPTKSAGLDGALRTLANRPYGPMVLATVALGLLAFGGYGLAAARWADIDRGRPSQAPPEVSEGIRMGPSGIWR